MKKLMEKNDDVVMENLIVHTMVKNDDAMMVSLDRCIGWCKW